MSDETLERWIESKTRRAAYVEMNSEIQMVSMTDAIQIAREAAAKAVEQERIRCAKVIEDFKLNPADESRAYLLTLFAAAIRTPLKGT